MERQLPREKENMGYGGLGLLEEMADSYKLLGWILLDPHVQNVHCMPSANGHGGASTPSGRLVTKNNLPSTLYQRKTSMPANVHKPNASHSTHPKYFLLSGLATQPKLATWHAATRDLVLLAGPHQGTPGLIPAEPEKAKKRLKPCPATEAKFAFV